jgi:hypothetical protein
MQNGNMTNPYSWADISISCEMLNAKEQDSGSQRTHIVPAIKLLVDNL